MKKKAWEQKGWLNSFHEGDVLFQKNIAIFLLIMERRNLDIEKLINRVKETVNKKTGVDLELEIKIIGE